MSLSTEQAIEAAREARIAEGLALLADAVAAWFRPA